MSEPIVILKGIGGSHAHGLATPESDEDVRGVFSYPTADFFTLNDPKETLDGHEPSDYTLHELKKWLRLAAKGNPDVLELLSLKEYSEMESFWGHGLLTLQPAILNTHGIRTAFLGYAEGQFKLLQRTGKFGAGMERRTWKHAKHMFRLIETAVRTMRTGRYETEVEHRDWYLTQLPLMSLEQIEKSFAEKLEFARKVKSVLPEEPNVLEINAFLTAYRKAH